MFTPKSIDLFFEQFPLAYWSNYDKIFVAVSGGRDSIYLLTQLVHIFETNKICVLHVNHGMRPTASRDEYLVQQYCEEKNIDFRVKRIDVFNEQNIKGIENTARHLRYSWFAENCKKEKGALFCGHTLDDQIETVLMNIYRGAGLAGLSGMSSKTFNFEMNIYRPLLGVSRASITKQLACDRIGFCDDESNAENLYFRNKIRNILMPKLSKNFISRVLSIHVASRQILEKIPLSDLVSYQHFLTMDLKELKSLPKISINSMLDLVYKKLGVEGAPSRKVREGFFSFMADEDRMKWELPSFVLCQKSREQICFFDTKNMQLVEGFMPLDSLLNKPLGIWGNVAIVDSSAPLPKGCFGFKLETPIDIAKVQVVFLKCVEGDMKNKLKKKMENKKIPAFFYEHWPIILLDGCYHLSRSEFENPNLEGGEMILFSGDLAR